tara:strand:+ start:1272 stop:2081 length:810 start_codon:yes stop_codon:yes gene_type:complete
MLNSSVSEIELFIFSDGAKNESSVKQVIEVRQYLKRIEGFKSIVIYESEVNNGLAKSVIDGVTRMFKTYNQIIVLEDDLIVSSNFFSYMNQSLMCYKNHREIISISGYKPPFFLDETYDKDVFFARRNTSWGWATWKDRWELLDWDIIEKGTVLNTFRKKYNFFQLGANLLPMYYKQKNRKIDSWSIRFTLNQYKLNMYTVYPVLNKVINIGFGDDATHTLKNEGFNEELDTTNTTEFNFSSVVEEIPSISTKFYKEYSLLKKIKNIIK